MRPGRLVPEQDRVRHERDPRQRWLAAHAADKSYVKTTNGTGPYMVKEWVSGDHITMVANPNYTGPNKPIAPTLIFKWADTAEKRLQDLQAGTVDGMDNVAPDDFDTVTNDTSLQLLKRDAFSTLYLGFNVDDAPWNNEAVRQAIAQGIDRKRILDLFDAPGSTVADYFTPCSVAGGCEGDAWYAYNKDAAIAALKAANFDFSKTYDLYFRPKVRQYFPNPPDTATEIQAQFKDLGINLKIHTEDNTTYLTNSSKGQYSLFLLGWGGDYPDMTDWVDYHFGIGGNDAFGTKFKDITDVLTKAALELDPAGRLADYATANNLIKQHVPMIPLTHAASSAAYKADVNGAHASPFTSRSSRSSIPVIDGSSSSTRTPSRAACTAATRATASRCASASRSTSRCTRSRSAGPTRSRAWRPLRPKTAVTVWTCKLQDNVKFADGSALDANDVVASFSAQWDPNARCTSARAARSITGAACRAGSCPSRDPHPRIVNRRGRRHGRRPL